MTKLQENARVLDNILSFVYKLNLVAAALVTVGLSVLWIVYFVSPESIISHSIGLNFEMIKMSVDPSIPHNPHAFVHLLIAVSIYFASYMVIWIMIIRCGSKILAPMVEGIPFHSQMADQLKQMAKLNIALGIADNLGMYAYHGNMIANFDLNVLFSNPGILSYSTEYPWDFRFLYLTAILFLLSYVFAHGWELQQLSDETL